MNIEAFLLALAMVESGNNPLAIGKAGEVTQYQITPAVWKSHARIPLSRAGDNPILAGVVAKKIIHEIRMSLPPHLSNDPFWIAVQWNGGRGACVKAEWRSAFVKRNVRDFADRVRAMYYVYEKDKRFVK